MSSISRTIDPKILIFTVPVMWGINFTVMKIGLQSLAPMPYNTSRLVLATIVCWILVFALKAYKPVEAKDWQPIVITSLLGFALPQLGITIGVSLTTAGNCSLIMALIPISVLIINTILGKEKVTKMAASGVFVSFFGVLLVILASESGLQVSSSDLLGIITIFGSQFFCAYYTVFSRPLVEKYSPFQVIAITMTVSSLVFVALSIRSLLNINWTQLSTLAWFSISYSGMFALAAGNFIWVWGVREIGSTRTSVFTNLTPVFAIITGVLVLHETFRLTQFMGAAIIITGLITTQKGQKTLYKDEINSISTTVIE